MLFVGIDPGLEGAIAGLDSETRSFIGFWDMPVKRVIRNDKTKEEIDRALFASLLLSMIHEYGIENILVLYEQLWGFGQVKQRQQGQFFFARDYGILLGCIATLQLKERPVPPQTWQNGVGKKGSEKYYSVERIIELYKEVPLVKPGCRTPHPDRAEAGLIAHFGLITHTQPKHSRITR